MRLPVAAALFAALGHLPAASAASFTLTDPTYIGDQITGAIIQVEGEILPGDLERLEEVLGAFHEFETGFIDGGALLALNSPGGSYNEAIYIGRMIREKGIGTRVAAGAACYSTCALIFMHGISKADGEEWPNRALHPKGSLGFNAPYLELADDVVPTIDMVEESYAAAMNSVAALLESAEGIFNPELLMKMLKTTQADGMLMVETVGDLLFWDIALDVEPPPITTLTYAQMVMACQTLDDLERGKRPSTTAAGATGIVDAGFGPKRLGVAGNGDEIYRFSLSDLNLEGCNLGIQRQPDNTLSVRYYGTSYADDPMPQTYPWSLDSLYVLDPSTPFATP
jgi:hypothetical protein